MTRYGPEPSPSIERFVTKLNIDETTGCWLWAGAVSPNGYGAFLFPPQMGAHRAAHLLLVGPIPEGLTIDHLCRVRRCVNPDHLEAVTMRENLLRGNTFQARNAAKTHCVRGHQFTPENTYRRPTDNGRICIECRRMHGRENQRRYRARLRLAVAS